MRARWYFTWIPTGQTVDANALFPATGSGNATVVWETSTTVNAATRPVGGAWGSPRLIETAGIAGPDSIASDTSGNVTAAWAVNDPTNGSVAVHAATRPAGSPSGAPASLGPCASTCVPYLAASRDGSIAVVGWSPSGPSVNAAVRLGLGTWSSTVVGSGSAKLTYLSRCSPRAHSSPGLERALANSSKAGDLVLDAFLGSGSTLVACERTGRICAGVELDPVYADVVLARFEPEC